VERLSRVLVEHQGNWIESRMARLSGQFAGILRVDLPAESVGSFTQACAALRAEGLSVNVTPTDAAQPSFAERYLLLEVIGHDRPGIVRDIAEVLARVGVNVEELTTGVESAPMSGDQLFRAKARLGVPKGLTSDALAQLLEPVGSDLMIDVTSDGTAIKTQA
jgi:glycine cleavage system regulatory protein